LDIEQQESTIRTIQTMVRSWESRLQDRHSLTTTTVEARTQAGGELTILSRPSSRGSGSLHPSGLLGLSESSCESRSEVEETASSGDDDMDDEDEDAAPDEEENRNEFDTE
jgi:hypothetical protein